MEFSIDNQLILQEFYLNTDKTCGLMLQELYLLDINKQCETYLQFVSHSTSFTENWFSLKL